MLTTRISGKCNRCGGPTSQETEGLFCWVCGHRQYTEKLPPIRSETQGTQNSEKLVVNRPQMPRLADNRYLTLTQAVEYTGYSRAGLRKQIREGHLEALLIEEDSETGSRALQAISVIDAKRLRDLKLRKTRRNTV